MTKSPFNRVEFLDHFRGVAILAVLLFHTLSPVFGFDQLPWNGWYRSFDAPDSFLCLLPLASAGVAGVAIFFVVSGFCIHASFHQQGRRWGVFFIRRFFRIYPPYLAALIFSILVLISCVRLNYLSWDMGKQYLSHLLLVHNLSARTLFNINASFWSLAVEAQLYLLYPLLLLFVAKLGWRRALLLVAAGEALIRGTDALVQTFNASDSVAGWISWGVAHSPLGFWFSWAIGAFVAEANLNKLQLPLLKVSPLLWLSLAGISYFVKPLESFQFPCFALATAAVLSRLLAGPPPAISVPALALALLKKIGLWSYSIYLLHQPLLNIFTLAVLWAVSPASFPAPIMFVLIAATWLPIMVISALWYRLIELPAIACGKRLLQKHEGRRTGQESAVFPPPDLLANGPDRRSQQRQFLLLAGALLVLVAGSLFLSAQLTPLDPLEGNNRAWTLATSPDPATRNGALAVKLAEDACQRTHYQKTVLVGTLAAAYAELGRFDRAILTAQQACTLAAQNGETNLLQKNQELLALFSNHQPYHVPQAGPKQR